jgi:hypothetical protein
MLLKYVCVRCCALLVGSLIAFCAAAQALAEETPAEVELFAAIERGEVEVVLIPRDSKKVTIQFANKTDKPLNVRLPEAFGAVPVLAQILPGGGGGPLFGGGGGAAQGLGIPGGGGNPLLGGGLMNIPPGKIVKVKRPAVCLEHGKPEPGPRLPYRIAKLEEVSDDAGVRELLTQYPLNRGNQRIAQLAAWHLANDKTWTELDALTIKHINRQVTRQFSREEIRAARRLVEALPSQRAEERQSRSVTKATE